MSTVHTTYELSIYTQEENTIKFLDACFILVENRHTALLDVSLEDKFGNGLTVLTTSFIRFSALERGGQTAALERSIQ